MFGACGLLLLRCMALLLLHMLLHFFLHFSKTLFYFFSGNVNRYYQFKNELVKQIK